MNVTSNRFKKVRTAAPSPRPTLPEGVKLPLPPAIGQVLGRVRTRYYTFRLLEGLALLAIVLPALWFLQALLDWTFDLSGAVRLLFLVGDGLILAALGYRFILKPLGRRLDLEGAALLVERSVPLFRTELISAVQLAAGGPGCVQGSVELVKRLLVRVANKIAHLDVAQRVVPAALLKRRVKFLVIVLLIVGAVVALTWAKSQILLQRILLSNAPLPTMTRVFPVSRDADIGAGSNLELSARAEGQIPKTGRLVIDYDDGRQETVSAAPKGDKPDVFGYTLHNVRQAFRYHFEINDGASEAFKVTTRLLPALASCRFTQMYPAYTGLGAVEMSSGNLSLLAGSRLRIEGEATQPLQSASLNLDGLNQKTDLELSGTDHRSFKAEIPIPRENLKGLTLELKNTRGESSAPSTYRIDVVSDKPPVVSLLLPKAEKTTALSDSRLTIAYSVKDDFGIKAVKLHYEVFRPPTPDQEPQVEEKGDFPLAVPPAGTTAPQVFVWELKQMIPPLTIGAFVRYRMEVEDNNAVSGPGTAQSRTKTVTIVSEEAKRLEMLEALGQKAAEIEQLYKTQQKINDKTGSALKSH